MSSRIEVATERFSQGFNCAQAVFSTYAPLLKVEEENALRISTGFGAGMGRLQETCGAVTGAIMAIGCRHGMVDPSDSATKETAYAQVQDFARRFRELHGTTSCKKLLGCDLTTADGRKQFNEKGLLKAVCTPCVRDACKILEETVLNDIK
jgi:C_GCAxxG_C_C family probable redox protein